jgi:hypothetical protein
VGRLAEPIPAHPAPADGDRSLERLAPRSVIQLGLRGGRRGRLTPSFQGWCSGPRTAWLSRLEGCVAACGRPPGGIAAGFD